MIRAITFENVRYVTAISLQLETDDATWNTAVIKCIFDMPDLKNMLDFSPQVYNILVDGI
jgi:hypothetical protein